MHIDTEKIEAQIGENLRGFLKREYSIELLPNQECSALIKDCPTCGGKIVLKEAPIKWYCTGCRIHLIKSTTLIGLLRAHKEETIPNTLLSLIQKLFPSRDSTAGQAVFTFGEHKGKKICEVEDRYLCWYYAASKFMSATFRTQIANYLFSSSECPQSEQIPSSNTSPQEKKSKSSVDRYNIVLRNGKHLGSKLSEVPRYYLEWYAGLDWVDPADRDNIVDYLYLSTKHDKASRP